MTRQYWLISDTHLGHENIVARFKRQDGTSVRHPFTTAKEVDEAITERWNQAVKPQDKVYHLGDVALALGHLHKVKNLNGHKRLIRGNHDIFDTRNYLQAGFEEILGCKVLEGVLMTHYPIHPGSMGRYLGNAHGHIHHNPSPPGLYMNLSVEAINYTPVNLDEVRTHLITLRARLEAETLGDDNNGD